MLMSDGELVQRIVTLNDLLPESDITSLLKSRPEILLMEVRLGGTVAFLLMHAKVL